MQWQIRSYNVRPGSVATMLSLHVYVAIGYHLYNYSLDCHNGNVCALAIMKSSPSFNQKIWPGPNFISSVQSGPFGPV